jgi:hypothetical protein
MFPRSILRLLMSLLALACLGSTGSAAVQWELSWESTEETVSMAPPIHEDGRAPTMDQDDYSSNSMDSQPAFSAATGAPCLLEARSFDVRVGEESLDAIEISGKVIRVPWRSFKVPI